MILMVNGKEKTVPDGTSLDAAVTLLTRDPGLVLAELNAAVIERTQWSMTPLKYGDRLELVSFVGGG